MSVVACPKCAEKVTLPPKTPPAAKVRCPLCAEEYLLSEAMSTLPPMLEVLELPEGYTPASEDVDISAAAFLKTADRPAVMDDDGELKLEGGGVATADELQPRYDEWGSTRSTIPAHDPVAAEIAAEVAEDELKPTLSRRDLVLPTARKKKKQVNPVMHIAGIVLGGVMAIPAALMILLWLPGNLQKDPLEIGPWLGKNVPFLVPASFRSISPSEPSSSIPASDKASSTTDKDNTDSTTSSLGGSRFEDALKDGNVKFGPGQETKPVLGKQDDEPIIDDTQDAKPSDEPEIKPILKPDVKPKPKPEPADEPDAPEDKPEPAPEPEKKPEPEPKADPEVSFELPDRTPPKAADPLAPQREALAAANKTFDEASTGAEKKAAAVALYQHAAELAEKLPASHDAGGLETLMSDAKKLQFFGVYAATWPEHQDRATPGVVLSGMVKSCKAAGERFEVVVELPSKDKRTMLLVSTAECAEGEKIFAAGRFVANAKNMIQGYHGDADMAVDARVLQVIK
jgi:outer membrane biosynthesis protein TonB